VLLLIVSNKKVVAEVSADASYLQWLSNVPFLYYAGMGMIFDIDGESAEKTIPSNFPVCGDFILD